MPITNPDVQKAVDEYLAMDNYVCQRMQDAPAPIWDALQRALEEGKPRYWTCPDCGFQCLWTYGDAADGGGPVCECGCDMNYGEELEIV